MKNKTREQKEARLKVATERYEATLRKNYEMKGVDIEKVQKVTQAYVGIARDNDLNFNELKEVQTLIEAKIQRSLDRLSISCIPSIS